TCVQAFSSSCPAPQDACLWSLTELLKKTRVVSHVSLCLCPSAIVGNLVTSFDFSLRIFCSQLLSEPRTEPASWETTFCLLLDLLEVLTASRFISGPGICRSPPLVQPSALLRTISCSSQNFVKNRTLLLLKRVLLQKVGEDWSLRGPRSEDLNSDPRVLAQSVLAAVKDGWLHTVHVEPGGFFGGTRPVRGDEGQKPGGAALRAVSLILLKSAELQVQTLDAAGENPTLICCCESYLQQTAVRVLP
uniref:Protein Lines N-terminal domain-containing protein n=1 Tax=Kryptolebias marmoratus TaxID=37003 RepID=A0A3Q3ANT2_KRYMA